MENTNKNETVSTDIIKIYQNEDEIVIFEYIPSKRIQTLKDAIQIVSLGARFFKNGKRPALIDMRCGMETTKEARDYFAGPENAQYLSACAMLVDSNITRTMANIFLKFNKPIFPTKLFLSKEKSLAWLSTFLYKNKNEKMKNHYIGKTSEIWIDEDGIYHQKIFKAVQHLKKNDIEEFRNFVKSLIGNEKINLIVYLNSIKTISLDARRAAADESENSHLNSLAIVTSSHVSSAIANFFIRFSKPKFPMVVLKSQLKAIEWTKIVSESKKEIEIQPFSQTQEILGALAQIASGNYEIRIPVIGSDPQLDDISIAINMLAEEIKNQDHELKQKNLQLTQSAKLASLGELSAGLAHELNNPLLFIVGFNNRIKAALKKHGSVTEKEIGDYLDEISNGAERMKKTIQHFREFSRQSHYTAELANINILIKNSFHLLSEQLKLKNIETIFDLDENITETVVDKNRLEQVFINLISNSKDAFESKEVETKKKISVKSSQGNDQIIIVFEDNGIGIKSEHIQKVFDPFFTTKEQGKGTGLGMSISYGIIKEHGGEIKIESTHGAGTRVTITLPIKAASEAHKEGAA